MYDVCTNNYLNILVHEREIMHPVKRTKVRTAKKGNGFIFSQLQVLVQCMQNALILVESTY